MQLIPQADYVVPVEIDVKGLFNLDVDDSIWQDTELDDSTDFEHPPPWLCDDAV